MSDQEFIGETEARLRVSSRWVLDGRQPQEGVLSRRRCAFASCEEKSSLQEYICEVKILCVIFEVCD
jgi:hypothetical protein